MFVLIALVVVSIIFPPAWLAVIGYVIYLVATKKKRRDNVLSFEIQKLVATGREEVVLKHIYYEAAKSFAADHGASMSRYKNDPEDDCLLFNMFVGDSEYSVCVQRWMKDETKLTVKPKAKARQDFINALGKDSEVAKILSR